MIGYKDCCDNCQSKIVCKYRDKQLENKIKKLKDSDEIILFEKEFPNITINFECGFKTKSTIFK